MPMDNFLEEVAVKRNRGAQSLLYGLCWVVMVAFGLFAFLLFSTLTTSNSMVALIGRIVVCALCAGVVFLIWRYKDHFRTEYEYTFTNGDLDVSKVLGNVRRSYLTCLPMKNVEACGLVAGNAHFQKWLTTPGIKKHNWFLNRDGQLVYFYFVKNNVKHLMIVELSDEMIKVIRSQNYLGFGVWQE
ncbi:MAG: hypothetical protein Q4A66_02385 [Eubacteriales bacterium]|nr:hypothetical protein [Eubacteriales bacterium]